MSKSHFRNPWRPLLTLCLSLGLGVFLQACLGPEADGPESWTQQDDELLEGFVTQEATFSLHNCPSGQEWDPIFGCQPMWGQACYDTRGPEYMGFEPFCSKIPRPSDPTPPMGQSCSSTRGSSWCGNEPSCYSCPTSCESTRGSGWCGAEPNCTVCTACSVSRNSTWWCGNEPACYACGPSCATTRGTGWCGTEPSCYTCTNGGGTSEGG